MIKKVNIEQLRPGIYIHDFGRKWMEHPFFTNKRKVASSWDIDRIREYEITEVYIDTTRGLNVLPVPVPINEWTKAFENKKAEQKLLVKKLPWASFKEELGRALEIREEVHRFQDRVAEELPAGPLPDMKQAAEIADKIFKSLVRNQNALLALVPFANAQTHLKLRHFSVAVLIGVLSRKMGFEPEQVKIFISGGLIYDCGMYLMPPELQQLDTVYTEQQKQAVRAHVNRARALFEQQPDFDSDILNMLVQHHERLDGSGYIEGVDQDSISIGGRLTALLDAYTAMCTERGYKPAQQAQAVYNFLLKSAAARFDQELVHTLLQTIGLYPVGSLVRLKSDFLAMVVGTPREDVVKPKVMLIYDLKKRRVVSPRTLDLSEGIGHLHSIVSQEPAAQWGLDLFKLLQPGTK